MESKVLTSGITDEDNNYFTLFYRIFFEEGNEEFTSGYSLVVEKKSVNHTERAIAPRISANKNSVILLAEKLCRNSVTPAALSEIIDDYITENTLP